MGSVLFDPGWEVPTSLSDVHFATLAGDLVYTWSEVGILSVLMRSQHPVNLERGCVEHLDVMFAQDTLDVVGGTSQVGESYGTRGLVKLALGIGDPTAGGGT